MMTSLAHSYTPHPGGMPQHTEIAQGHPMSHNPSHPGQPGPVIPQQIHMGVSAPGAPSSQGQVVMAGMPSGAGGHALQHLSPSQQQAQAQIFQQQAMCELRFQKYSIIKEGTAFLNFTNLLDKILIWYVL